MWKKIWKGPFYVGRRPRPLSFGDIIMKMMEKLWRWAILLLIALAALFAWVCVDGLIDRMQSGDQRDISSNIH